MRGDVRSRRVAVVTDAVVNDPRGAVDALIDAGWGLIQLPPTDLPAATRVALLEMIAEQVDEYQRHGYVVCACADADRDLALIESRCRSSLPRHADGAVPTG